MTDKKLPFDDDCNRAFYRFVWPRRDEVNGNGETWRAWFERLHKINLDDYHEYARNHPKPKKKIKNHLQANN